jgi:hypothetical protein
MPRLSAIRGALISLGVTALLLGALAPSVSATTTFHPVHEVVTGVTVDPGVVTLHGNTMSIRGQHNVTPVVDEVLGPGTDENWIDVDFNLATGAGSIRGKTTISYESFGGGWDCTFAGHFDPAQFFSYSAREVCQGYDALSGAQLQLWFHSTGVPGQIESVGYWFFPGDRQG